MERINPMEQIVRPRSRRAIGARPNVSMEEFERKRKAFFDKHLRDRQQQDAQEDSNETEGRVQDESGKEEVQEPALPEPPRSSASALPRTYRLSYIQSVPTPLFIFDLSRDLRGSEVKVLLVVVRQTLGWKAGGGKAGAGDRRVASAVISQAAFKEQTGLAAEAISHAVDNLVRRGIVQTHTTKGKPLPTKEERRRLMGPVCFRLAREWVETLNGEE